MARCAASIRPACTSCWLSFAVGEAAGAAGVDAAGVDVGAGAAAGAAAPADGVGDVEGVGEFSGAVAIVPPLIFAAYTISYSAGNNLVMPKPARRRSAAARRAVACAGYRVTAPHWPARLDRAAGRY